MILKFEGMSLKWLVRNKEFVNSSHLRIWGRGGAVLCNCSKWPFWTCQLYNLNCFKCRKEFKKITRSPLARPALVFLDLFFLFFEHSSSPLFTTWADRPNRQMIIPIALMSVTCERLKTKIQFFFRKLKYVSITL